MLEFFKKDSGIICLITIIFCALIPFFFLHQGLLLIDTGREFYIPSQILNGSVLDKDISNFYGTLSYQFNAFLFLIFGQKINVLCIAGIINSFIIVLTCYLLSCEFLKKDISFLLTMLIMSALVFRTFLYNSVLPYSFAIVYALSAFLLSVLFLTKYLKNGSKNTAYLACFFAGISFANKYEFLLYILLLFITLSVIKPIGAKDFFKSAAAFAIIPVISFGSLLFQGFNFDDLKNTFILFQNMINSPILKLFFSHFGAFPSVEGLMLLIAQNKIYSLFAILPVLNLIMFIHQIKDIYKNKPLFIFILCSILACAKNFFYLNVNHMGVFLFPVCIIASVILLEKYIKKFLPLILTVCILIFISDDFASLKYKDYMLNTPKGKIYTYQKDGRYIEYVCDYLLKNSGIKDKAVVLPEGSIINFLTDRQSDNFYYSLIPLLYIDVFKEKNIISHFKKNMPEFFVILPIDNSEYGSGFFGVDYAANFYEMIVNNYDLDEEKNGIKIFKRKNM